MFEMVYRGQATSGRQTETRDMLNLEEIGAFFFENQNYADNSNEVAIQRATSETNTAKKNIHEIEMCSKTSTESVSI